MEYNDNLHYCGPRGVFRLPRKYFGVDINYSCYLHDKDYIDGVDRKQADKDFMNNVYESFRAAGKSRFLSYVMSKSAYATVRAVGLLSKYR